VAPTLRAQLQIHFCVFLWGFTAILGKLISLPALPLVWWRMLLVAGTLALLPRIWRHLANMSRRLRWAYAGIGALVALHWVTFYASIKLSNASVAATCMAMGSVFVSMIEPLLAKRAFRRRELLLGVAVIPGVMLVVGGVPSGMHLGIAIGVFSAFIVAIFSALNKRLVEHADPLAVTALEMAAGAATVGLLSPLLLLLFPMPDGSGWWPDLRDGGYLLLLAYACTLLPFTLSLIALRHMSAFSAQMAVNLEPVYTIAFAIVLFHEQRELGWSFYLGVTLLLLAVTAHPLLDWWHTRRQQPAQHPEMLMAAEAKDIID